MTDNSTSPPSHLDRPNAASRDQLAGLRPLRWAVRAVLTLGVAASIAANVLHARPNLISQLIAAWPPLALLLTVELISRVPSHRRSLAALRLLATAAIAGIAGWVSYWHMVGVAARYGEIDAGASYLLPISVDGLVVVASISLVEITGRIRAGTSQPTPTQQPTARQDRPGHHSPRPGADRTTRRRTPRLTKAVTEVEPTATSASPTAVSTRASSRGQAASTRGAESPGRPPEPDRDDGPGDSEESRPVGGARADDARTAATIPSDHDSAAQIAAATPAAVAYWYQRDPSMHPAQIAERIGRSERTVRRYWPPAKLQGSNAHHHGPHADHPRAP
ncbi:DUF2637 domain-containing protein [Micromonospora aurantiaca (nom. illeg.)]|uniref:DUF2637 domain-containing protein n=1 Tax=Micromonospora aurantiaca (nom. illeg.) TaxID=47850 RepID=UPI00165754FA|nr:DUF2637 domain-containing protein [Micromonospora aurantiaca]MBC9006803.1 DUF2637 domain-containing protein [Micromonospora aurantiaca]